MARPPKTDGEKRTQKIEVRLTPDEKSQITGYAGRAGMTPSDFVRHAAFSAKPVRKVATPDRTILLKLQADLGKVGSNLNQIAHVLNLNAKNGEPVQVSESTIIQVSAQVSFLIKSLQEELRNGNHG